MDTTQDHPPSSSRPHRAWRWEIGAALIALASVGLRCMGWRAIFGPDGITLPGVDPYYHLWRVRMLIEHFPASPTWDAFIGFPAGGPIPWPPGFDLLVAAPGLMGLGQAALTAWGALLPPLLGGLAVYLTWRLGKAAFDRPTGLVAAGLLACTVGAIHFSRLGRIDHHALVAPLSLATALAFIRALSAPGARARIAWASLGAGLAALATASWIVTPALYFLPVLGMVVWAAWQDPTGAARPVALWGFAGAAGLVGLVVLWAGDLAQRPFSLYLPSLLHLALYLLAAAVAVGVAWRSRRPVWISCGLIACAILGLGLAGGLTAPVAEALGVALGRDPSYSLVMESRSLLSPRGVFSFTRAMRLYSALCLAWPLMVAALLRSLVRGPAGAHARRLVALWAALGLTLLLAQERFGEFAAPALVLVTAWAMVALARIVIARVHATRAGPWRWLPAALFVLATAGALWPLAGGLAYLATEDPVAYQRELVRFGRDLRAHTPEPVDALGRLRWGLLTGWMDAHPLLQTAGRPVSTSSFGTAEALAANRVAFGLLLATDEDAAADEMGTRRLRYLVASNQVNQIEAMAAMAGRPERFVDEHFGRIDGEAFRAIVPREPYFETIGAKLWLADGACRWPDGSRRPGLGRFRLILESAASRPVLGMRPAMFKAFERVAGAELSGRAAPGSAVRLRLDVQTNTGRRFTYTRGTEVDQSGRFHLRVPYATAGGPGPSRAIGPYRIQRDGAVVHLRVDEAAVQAGRTVSVPPVAAGPEAF